MKTSGQCYESELNLPVTWGFSIVIFQVFLYRWGFSKMGEVYQGENIEDLQNMTWLSKHFEFLLDM